MKSVLCSKWWLSVLLILAFGLVFAAPAYADVDTGVFQITVVDEAGNPLANYPADYPSETRNLKYKYRYGGSWAPEVSFQTDANGQTFVSINPAHLASWDKKITVTLNGTSKEQDVRVNSVFQAAKVNVNLKSCTGPISAVPGGTVAQSVGFWYTHGTTGPSGTVTFYSFPATVTVRMSYNHNSQTFSRVIVAGTNEVDFQTTRVTLTWPGDIKSNTGGSWWMFSKPSMDLLPGSYNFYYQTGSTWNGPVLVPVSGCELTYPPIAVNHPPVASAGGPYTSVEGATIQLDASASSDPDGTIVSYEWDLDADGTYDDASGQMPTVSFADDGGYTASVRVTDDEGASATADAIVIVSDRAPVAAFDWSPEPQDEGSAVAFTDQSTSAPDGLVSWSWDFDGDGAADSGLQSPTHTYDDDGIYTVSLTVADDDGSTKTVSHDVTIGDLAPTAYLSGPVNRDEGQSGSYDASGSTSSPDLITGYEWDWSYDGVTFVPSGDTGASATHTWPDNGSYTVAVRVTDDGGSTGIATLAVIVNNVAPTVGAITAPLAPLAVNTSFTASASFTDPGVLDTHTTVWDWGDGSTSAGTVAEANGSGSVSGSHAYTVPGVYTLRLTVTDKDGGWAQASYEFVVVYDPSAGFVTGGGWIMSPAGAYAADSSLVGKATFGFVSKYKKGASVPDGNTEFQFKAGNLNFKSTAYEWLVIAGAKAQYKGFGAINGAGEYRFMLTAWDGQVNGGGGVDKFRIRIWDNTTGGIIYDNQMNAGDNADPTTALGGGSIVIHN